MLTFEGRKQPLSTWVVVRAVEALIKMHAPKNWARSFVNELEQSKKHKCFNDDNVASTAQYLCESVFVLVTNFSCWLCQQPVSYSTLKVGARICPQTYHTTD